MMKTMLAALCLSLFTGCSFASVEARHPGRYVVDGYTTDPAGAIAASSDAYVQETYADTYREAVESGMAYPYAGGAVGNDYSFYYGGIIPPTGTQQVQGPVQSVDPQARETADEALKRANDSLRMHKKLRQELSGSASPQGGK